MDPQTIALIAQGLQFLVANAPSMAEDVKRLIDSMNSKNVIDAATQNALKAHVDAWCAAALSDKLGPEWTVEPDPK